MGQRISATRDGSTSQPPQAETVEAAADSQCPICLGVIENAAYVAYCMHRFCCACIQQWAARSQTCPMCRQPFQQLLHSVRGDNDYEEYMVGLPTHLDRTMATERARSQSLQHSDNLQGQPPNQPMDNHPTGSHIAPVGRQPSEQLLPSWRRDDDHVEYMVGLHARPRWGMAPEKSHS